MGTISANERDLDEPGCGARQRRVAAKHRAILDAATGLFMENGFDATSMDAVAERAGVAKQTLYNHFGGKEALFAAICGEMCGRLLGSLAEAASGIHGPLEAALLSVARQFCDIVLSPSTLAVHRTAVAEAARVPDLGPSAWAAGGEPALASLAGFLAERQRRGELTLDDPRLAAERFFGSLTGFLQIRALLQVEARPAPATLERWLQGCVAAFLAAHRPPGRA